MIRLALIGLLFLLTTVLAVGDGMYAKLGAITKNPGIPYQRAVIGFRDGVETMVVESTFDGEPGDYAWIVPVPNPPTTVIAADEHALDTAFRRPYAGPKYWSAGPDLGALLVPVGIWIALIGLALVFDKRETWSGISPTVAAVLLALLGAILVGVFAPVYAQAKIAAKGSNADWIGYFDAGSYDVNVLRANRVEDLEGWMKEHGGALPDAAKGPAEEYIRQKWCFAVASLKRHAGGLATPHPLVLKFPVSAPVYPMRLTGTQSTPLLLDLLIIAKGTAMVDRLRCWGSIVPRKSQFQTYADEDILSIMPMETLLFPQAAVTRCRGIVSRDAMQTDFAINLKPFEESRLTVRSMDQLLASKRDAAVAYGGLALLVAAMLTRRRPPGLKIGLTLAAAFVAAAVAYVNVDREWVPIEPKLAAQVPR